jgi:hypothetical protein
MRLTPPGRTFGWWKRWTREWGYRTSGRLVMTACRGVELHFVRDHSASGSRIALDYTGTSNPALNNPLHLYARWGEPWIFGFPNSSAREYVQQDWLGVLSDTPGLEYICVAEVLDKR